MHGRVVVRRERESGHKVRGDRGGDSSVTQLSLCDRFRPGQMQKIRRVVAVVSFHFEGSDTEAMPWDDPFIAKQHWSTAQRETRCCTWTTPIGTTRCFLMLVTLQSYRRRKLLTSTQFS
ncbi:hypothetical protein RESH_04464 [Rhodopirellula europaea SH398]|uniref:Uncharacterized protein n=1 Tax=Rhodopirellula europaea SH398 TaxID=1263868 RepID=M5S037_9BACT|nr:hypothetical protein RESH_04464 [Rhodopirellula europaea SH398]